MTSIETEKVGRGGTGIPTTEKSHETSREKTETNQEGETNGLMAVMKSQKNVTASGRTGLRGHKIELKGYEIEVTGHEIETGNEAEVMIVIPRENTLTDHCPEMEGYSDQ